MPTSFLLPPEIWYQIISILNIPPQPRHNVGEKTKAFKLNQNLLNLSQTNSFLRSICLPLLLEIVDIDLRGAHLPNARFLKILLHNATLCRSIKSLTIRLRITYVEFTEEMMIGTCTKAMYNELCTEKKLETTWHNITSEKSFWSDHERSVMTALADRTTPSGQYMVDLLGGKNETTFLAVILQLLPNLTHLTIYDWHLPDEIPIKPALVERMCSSTDDKNAQDTSKTNQNSRLSKLGDLHILDDAQSVFSLSVSPNKIQLEMGEMFIYSEMSLVQRIDGHTITHLQIHANMGPRMESDLTDLIFSCNRLVEFRLLKRVTDIEQLDPPNGLQLKQALLGSKATLASLEIEYLMIQLVHSFIGFDDQELVPYEDVWSEPMESLVDFKCLTNLRIGFEFFVRREEDFLDSLPPNIECLLVELTADLTNHEEQLWKEVATQLHRAKKDGRFTKLKKVKLGLELGCPAAGWRSMPEVKFGLRIDERDKGWYDMDYWLENDGFTEEHWSCLKDVDANSLYTTGLRIGEGYKLVE